VSHCPPAPTCHRYVPGAPDMNVNSGVQIRQLPVPDSCEGPTKMFKALNPDYDPTIKPRRAASLTLSCMASGAGREGRLAVDVTTDKVGR